MAWAEPSGLISGARPAGESPSEVWTTLSVVVLDGLPEQASQMVFAEHDHVVEKLPANAADEALGCPVLPRASKRGAHGLDPEPFDREGDFR
jgi:hypothetical protein